MVNQSLSTYNFHSDWGLPHTMQEFYKFKCLSLGEVGSAGLLSSLSTVYEFSLDNNKWDCDCGNNSTAETSAHRKLSYSSSLPTILMESHSVVILGELSVGKSALCQNFFCTGINESLRSSQNGMRSEKFSEVSEDVSEVVAEETFRKHHIYERPMKVDGLECQIRILDVNTEKQISECSETGVLSNLSSFLDTGEGYIVAYAVTDKGTFQTAHEILNKISQLLSSQNQIYPVILVGNKCDLVRKRQVSTNEGIKLAEKYGVKFVETSASLNQNVDILFEGMIKLIRLAKIENLGVRAESPSPKLISKRGLATNFLSALGNFRTNRGDSIVSNSTVQSSESCSSKSNSTGDFQNDFGSKRSKGKSFLSRCKYGLRRRKTTTCLNACQDLTVL
ncbi:GTP-binding protein GEM-like [Clavelina lepadiformis]|uniref:GTP-binding protein GEM-like n=1 Tax=Clavelina lepadiformis TaxID=159417 RepID=UPI004041F9FB